MVTVASDRDAVRRLNHLEMVYRPGERELATRVFELLGMRVLDNGGPWMFAHVDPTIGDTANNACYASEMTPEQWAFEQALATAIATEDDDTSGVGAEAAGYLARLRGEPQRSFHFGVRLFERDDFDATLDRIRDAANDPELAGRVELIGVYHPRRAGRVGAGDDPGVRAHRCRRGRVADVRPARRTAVAPASRELSSARRCVSECGRGVLAEPCGDPLDAA